MQTRVSLAALALLAVTAHAQERPAPTKIDVADGVFLFRTAPYGPFGLDGNSVVIVGGDGVLVFDTNGTPAAAAAVLAGIRRLTPLPVRYVVNSHWHWDHWYGTEVYTRAFPGVKVVAHERTRAMMMGPALAFNRPGVEQQLPDFIAGIEKKIAALEAASPGAPELPRLRAMRDEGRFFLAQKAGVHHTLPDVTFTDRLEIDLGGRRVQVLHYERAVTPGDAFLYLPDQKVLVAGDLLGNPVSFALSCYPSGWLRTLERIDALDASVIVPGHGDPLRDRERLRATMDVMRVLLREGKAMRDKGLDPDEARQAILPGLHDLKVRITKDDPAVNDAFAVQFVDWYLHRAYDELAGPLTDDIAPIPKGN